MPRDASAIAPGTPTAVATASSLQGPHELNDSKKLVEQPILSHNSSLITTLLLCEIDKTSVNYNVWGVMWYFGVLLVVAAVAQPPLPGALEALTGDYATWVANASTFRSSEITKLQYNATSALYPNAQLTWAAGLALVAEVQLFDMMLHLSVNVTASAYLDDLQGRVGPVDAVVLWSSLPAVGVDARGQAQRGRDDGLGAAIRALQTASPGLKVFVGWLPWDTGTSPDASGLNDTALLTSAALNASAAGVWLRDTGAVPATAAATTVPGTGNTAYFAVAVEGDIPDAAPDAGQAAPLSYQLLSRSPALLPGPAAAQLPVSTLKWLEARHTPVVGSPWTQDHTLEVQSAFLNGGAVVVCENAFGGYSNLLTPRDAALTARATNITRFLAPLTAAAQATPDGSFTARTRVGDDPLPLHWLPLYPVAGDGSGSVMVAVRSAPCPAAWRAGGAVPSENCTAYLLANLGATDAAALVLNISLGTRFANMTGGADPSIFNLYTGKATVTNAAAGAPDTCNVTVEAHGITALLVIPGTPGPALQQFLTVIANLTALPLSSYASTWSPLQQQQSAIQPTPGAPSAPPGMALIQGATQYTFQSFALLPELFRRTDAAAAMAGPGADIQYPWEAQPSTTHSIRTTVFPFYMDKLLVTHDDFAAFLMATGYAGGGDDTAFLRDWLQLPNSSYAVNTTAGDGPRPVVWVSRDDAQAYCKWRGKRLPLETEWQYASQAVPGGGSDYRQWPTGNTSCSAAPPDSKLCPPPDNSTAPRAPDAVGSYPAGASAFGLQDLVGLVWQITDSYCDARQCAAVLKGGSLYVPVDAGAAAAGGPNRYFPAGDVSLTQHARLPYGVQANIRSGYVGFRCAADTPQSAARAQGAAKEGTGRRYYGAVEPLRVAGDAGR